MRIHCDTCGAPLEKDDAIVHELDEGEIYWFCSEECYESSERVLADEAEDERAEQLG